MKQQQSKINQYRKTLQSMYEQAKTAEVSVALDSNKLDEIFALPSPTKERKFVEYVLNLHGCGRRNSLAA